MYDGMRTRHGGLLGRTVLGVLGLAIAASGAAERTTEQRRQTVNGLGMTLVRIPAGEFTMGSGHDFNDTPSRTVRLTRPFLMGTCEVTQAQFKTIMGRNPSWLAYRSPTRPVECASWHDAVEFCRRLSETEGRTYRLPTEAEWEHACKAGEDWMAAEGRAGPEHLDDYAWTPTNTNTETQPVGKRKPNPWGLYDMLGNVYEWCADWYDDIAYREAETVDPTGPKQSSNTLGQGGRVARGGSALGGGMNCLRTHRCTSTARNTWTAHTRHRGLGFRVVADIE